MSVQAIHIKEKKYRRNGMLVTALIHLLIIFLLFYLTMPVPDPPLQEEVMEVFVSAGSAGGGEAAQASAVTGAARFGSSSATRSQRQWSILSHLVGRHHTDTISEWLHDGLRGGLLGSLRHRLATLAAYARAGRSSPAV